MFFADGVPSSSNVIDPRRSFKVPSSKTVTPFAAICLFIRLEKADVPFLLKSPSKPCPIASCSKMPGQPGPKTISITPAGAGTACKFTKAIRRASSAVFCQCFFSRSGRILDRPPPPAVPVSRRPSCSTMIEILSLVIGLVSLTENPSGLRISISCVEAAREILT